MAEAVAALIHPSRIVNRWAQLIAGIIAMMAIANLQYAWTLFTKPMQAHLHVSLTAIQGIFTAFILVETWLVPFEGYLVDRIGPRLMLIDERTAHNCSLQLDRTDLLHRSHSLVNGQAGNAKNEHSGRGPQDLNERAQSMDLLHEFVLFAGHVRL